MFEKFMPLEGGSSTEHAKQLHKSAERVGQYKLCEEALFYPDGRYVLLSEIKEPQFDTCLVTTKGCCGVVLQNPAVVFYVGGNKYRILADNDKQAKKLMTAMLNGAN